MTGYSIKIVVIALTNLRKFPPKSVSHEHIRGSVNSYANFVLLVVMKQSSPDLGN